MSSMVLTGMLPFQLSRKMMKTELVRVAAPMNPLSEEHYSELQTTLPVVLDHSVDDYGLTFYMDCVRFVQMRVE